MQIDPELAARFPRLAAGPHTCRACGCSDGQACSDDEFGPCWWAEPDLCSHCAEPLIVMRRYERLRGAIGDRPATVSEVQAILAWANTAYFALEHVSRSSAEDFEPQPAG